MVKTGKKGAQEKRMKVKFTVRFFLREQRCKHRDMPSRSI